MLHHVGMLKLQISKLPGANAITDNKRKKALLLYIAGPRVQEIFRLIPDTGDEAAFATALKKLNKL